MAAVEVVGDAHCCHAVVVVDCAVVVVELWGRWCCGVGPLLLLLWLCPLWCAPRLGARLVEVVEVLEIFAFRRLFLVLGVRREKIDPPVFCFLQKREEKREL